MNADFPSAIVPEHVHIVTGAEVRTGKMNSTRADGRLESGDVFVQVRFADDAEEISCPRLWRLYSPEAIDAFAEFIETLIKARDAAAALMHYDPEAEVHCPSCGRQIYGRVKIRGFCFDCVPASETVYPRADV
jgi:hypothetical protein